MAKEVNLLSYWMPVLRGIKEFKQIALAEEPEIVLLLNACDRALSNMFIETADEAGIERFERLMGITLASDASLEVRRFNAQVKWGEAKPYTEAELNKLLSNMLGEGNYGVAVNYADYEITVKLGLGQEDMVDTVAKLLEQVVPVNMVINITTYNTHFILSAYTHEQLSSYTHSEVREAML